MQKTTPTIRLVPQPSRLKLPPLPVRTDESVGDRLARLRKERGYTQVELAKKMGIVQALVSSYERERLRLHAEMVIRFAVALDVTTDELLGLEKPKSKGPVKSRRVLRRLQQIEKLPKRDQDALLRTIDAVLAARNTS